MLYDQSIDEDSLTNDMLHILFYYISPANIDIALALIDSPPKYYVVSVLKYYQARLILNEIKYGCDFDDVITRLCYIV